jgi:hypothetical protein
VAALAVALITLVWEASEYLAQQAELKATGRDISEINMQWDLRDAFVDTIANFAGLIAAVAVRRANDPVTQPRFVLQS